MVLAPPEFEPIITPLTALNKARTSIPEWALNRMSSVDKRALTRFGFKSWYFILLLFSKKYLPKTTPSEEMISVAKLLLGFSSSSKVGSSPNRPTEVR